MYQTQLQVDSSSVKQIVVVGGGTAGWITAGRIAAQHGCAGVGADANIQVTLVESPNVPNIGVGEGTWPTMRNTLSKLGITETDFIRACDASFKQGAKFAQWVRNDPNEFYYHPLVLPQGFTQANLAPYWLAAHKQAHEHAQNVPSFSEAVCYQEAICEQGLAPKTIRTPEFSAVANYAYHLNAGKFIDLLHQHCTEKLGVKYVSADVRDIKTAPNGDVLSVLTEQAGEISGDLFVDCTGFQSLLLGKTLGVPFKSCSDVLFIDNALAVQVPYEHPDAPIASHTISTGQTAGWIWDIGLQSRRGVGYVYSSRHSDEQQAMETLENYVGKQFADLSVKKIAINSGHREQFWKNNVVAVGLAAGFLEPLEASALVLVELSAEMIATQLPANRATMSIVAKRFNDTFLYRWERIIDFLKLHYLLTQRSDSQFWIDNVARETVPDSLHELLQWWRYHPPYDYDFTSNNEVFPSASYQYVLYGMGFHTDLAQIGTDLAQPQFAQEQFAKNQRDIAKLLKSLPSNRELLNKINQYGLQSI